MQTEQQTIECAIDCVRCGMTREDLLTEEEAERLNAAIGPIYRDCTQCEKTTGWIRSARSPVAAKELPWHQSLPQPVGGKGTESQTINGQERMATQAERDTVNSMVHNTSQNVSTN
jgi:hypothetical protein